MASHGDPELTDDDSDYVVDSYEKTSAPEEDSLEIAESFCMENDSSKRQSIAYDDSVIFSSKGRKNLRIIESDEEGEDSQESSEADGEEIITEDESDKENDSISSGSLHSIEAVGSPKISKDESDIENNSNSSHNLHSIEETGSPNVSVNNRMSKDFRNINKLINSTAFDDGNFSNNKLSPRKSLFNPSNTFHEAPTVELTPKSQIIISSPSPSSSKTPTTNMQFNQSMLTPRVVRHDISSRSPSPSSSEDIVSVSSDEDVPVTPKPRSNRTPFKQTTLDYMVLNKENTEGENQLQQTATKEVSPTEYKLQKEKLQKIHSDMLKAKNVLNSVNLNTLPDKGNLLRLRHANLEQKYNDEFKKLEEMNVSKEDVPIVNKAIASWADIQAGVTAVQPKTFGKQAMATYNAQKALTVDRLHQLHGSLEKCPKEDTMADDPKGLKIELMPHQKRALAWLMFRETQKPSGGILADDMGLGKTLTMISLMLKTNEIEKKDDDSSDSDEENNENVRRPKYQGGTLIVCPASLLNQWSSELENRAKRGLASYDIFHGVKREKNARVLSQYDMVITTYSIVKNENDSGAIFRIKWRRIVLDEAHQIRNYKSITSMAVFNLAAKSRWALTGTPIHNKELDMFALLKFLRCSPFDDLQVWRRWVGDKSVGGIERLHTVISSLMLRRTKAELIETGALNRMPERKYELLYIQLDKLEQEVYQRVNLFSKTLFAQFLHQRAEKNQEIYDSNYATSKNANNEYFKMREKLLRINKIQDVSQHHILVLLLRLRQICCHPSLINKMIGETDDIDDGEEMEEINILEQLDQLKIDDEVDLNTLGDNSDDKGSLKEASKGLLNPSNPVFSDDHLSSKIKAVLNVLEEKVLSTADKAIIVSQFPSFLNIVGRFLKEKNVFFDQLDGKIPVPKRMTIVDTFNDKNNKMQVLLLSLTAGGVGLNLTGGNHLFLLDLHWNPQLENQAQDRIYRMGQTKPVFVYKFIATDTVEERIKNLQDSKLECARAMLTGTKQVTASKLSLKDLKMLFDM